MWHVCIRTCVLHGMEVRDPAPRPCKTPLSPLVPIWADDLAIGITANNAEEVIQRAQDITARIFDRLTAAALIPNLKPGKSELLADLRGKRVRKVRAQISRDDSTLMIPSEYAPGRPDRRRDST